MIKYHKVITLILFEELIRNYRSIGRECVIVCVMAIVEICGFWESTRKKWKNMRYQLKEIGMLNWLKMS
ncbi:hypothetical protein V6B71_08660 [Mediterraneibacter gnavus]|nr:hypothetical protein [Mediterraneibacter gnavus]